MTRSIWLLSAALLAGTTVACGDDGSSGSAGSGASGGAGVGGAGATVSVGVGGAPAAGEPLAGWERVFEASPPAIDCTMTLGQLEGTSAPMINLGGGVLVAGYRQDGQNQNPVIMRFDGGILQYCVEHETGEPDGRAYGLSWDGGAVAYVVFTVVGGGSGLEAWATNGWLSSYGEGGGPKISFVGRLDADTGALTAGSFVIAKKSDGTTNSHSPIDAPFPRVGGGVELRGDSALVPLNPDQSAMACSDQPFLTKYVLSDDLSSLLCASSSNCIAATPCDP